LNTERRISWNFSGNPKFQSSDEHSMRSFNSLRSLQDDITLHPFFRRSGI
jgi:hypothetical protein